MPDRATILALATAGALAAGSVAAQSDTESGQDAERADPFSADAVLRSASQAPTSSERRFRPAPSLPEQLPLLTLRGVGRSAVSDPPTAILEIGDLGTFVVRPGDVLSLQNLPGENVLRIKSIDDISVTVEAGSFGEIIVVR